VWQGDERVFLKAFGQRAVTVTTVGGQDGKIGPRSYSGHSLRTIRQGDGIAHRLQGVPHRVQDGREGSAFTNAAKANPAVRSIAGIPEKDQSPLSFCLRPEPAGKGAQTSHGLQATMHVVGVKDG